jgi:hypothetical protein
MRKAREQVKYMAIDGTLFPPNQKLSSPLGYVVGNDFKHLGISRTFATVH